eukprot:Skav202407  [mRNA]  locus=scaffold815:507175:507786:+ [translate_table: standard]
MACSSSFLALNFGDAGLAALDVVAQAIQARPKDLLGADVGFEATSCTKLHATFVFHAELLHDLPKTQLVTW